MSDIDTESFNKAISDVSERFLSFGTALESMKKQTDLAKDGLKNTYETNRNYSRLLSERSKRENDLLRAQREGRATANETRESLALLNQQVLNVIPPELAPGFMKLSKMNGFVTGGLIGFQKALVLVTPSLSLMGSAVNGLINIHQNGATEMEAATTGFTLGINTIIGGSKLLSNGLSAVGSAAMGAAPGLLALGPEMVPLVGIIEILGGAAKLAGDIWGGFNELADETAKAVLPILNKELENNYKAFIDITNSGGLFARGLTDMLGATSALNLTLPQFNEVLRSESDNLSRLGLSVGEAARQMGGVGAVLKRDKLDVQLRNIGLSAKDQAATIAETMATMRQSGGLLTADNDTIARETATYAQNLKIISAITGEDAKKKEAQVKEENSRLAFQQKLNGLDAQARLRVISMQQGMSDLERKAFQQTFVFGQAVTPEIAYAVNNIRGLGDLVNDAMQSVEDGTAGGDKIRQLQEQYGQTIKDSTLQQEALGKAGLFGVPIAEGIERLLGHELEFLNKATPEAIKTATENINQLFTKPDGVTSAMTEAATAGQNLQVSLNQLSMTGGVLEKYAKSVGSMSEAMTAFVDKWLKGDSGDSGNRETGISEKEQNAIKSAIQDGKILTNAQIVELKAINETQLNALATKLGVSVDAIAKSAGFDSGTNLTNAQADFQIQQTFDQLNAGNFATGGIVSGPTSGFPAMLHGSEAIIPLPDGVTGPEFAQALQGLAKYSTIINDTENAAQRVQNSVAGLSAELLTRLNNKMDDLIAATGDVANYTRQTSMRIQ